LKPRHFRTQELKWEAPAEVDAVRGRRLLFANADVAICFVAATTPSPLYRNASGDELLYVQGGAATVETVYGTLDLADGYYVVLPTSCTRRIVPTGDDPLLLLVLEATGHIGPPRRYLAAKGQFLEQSPYCERDQRGPAGPLLAEGTDVDVYVRHRA